MDRFALLLVHGLCSLFAFVIEGGMAVDGQGPVWVYMQHKHTSHYTLPPLNTTLVVADLSVIFLVERH